MSVEINHIVLFLMYLYYIDDVYVYFLLVRVVQYKVYYFLHIKYLL